MTTPTTTPALEFPWNLVTREVHGHELLRKKIGEKIGKLGRRLTHFSADAVHLHIALEGHADRSHFIAALTLRLPSTILRARKTGPDVITAFDDAMRALLREVQTHLARLRREAQWKPAARRRALHERKAAGFAALPQPESEGPRELRDVVAELLARNHAALLRHVRRVLEHEVLAGELRPGAIDPRAVVDEAARRALMSYDEKPAEIGWLAWLYRLAAEELARRRAALATEEARALSLERTRVLPEDAEAAAGYDAERPLDIIAARLEPPVVATRETLPDPRAVTPGQVVERRDLLGAIQDAVAHWPGEERTVFELHFVEGFPAEEVAMVLGEPVAKVRTAIARVQRRVRAQFGEEAGA